MQNNVNTFNAAKMNGAKDQLFQQRYNYLIDILSQQIKILNASINGGLTITNAGILTLGNELEALQALSDAAGFVTKTGDGTYAIDASDYQPLNNELTALSNLADTSGLMKKIGDGTYSMLEGTAENDFIVAGADLAWTVKTLAQVQTLIGASSGAESNWRFV